MNEVAEKLTGWTLLEAKGKPFNEIFNIINEFTRSKVESPIKKVFETGEIIELENHTLLIKKNGDEIPIEDSAAPIKDEMGNMSGVVIVFRDFTEKKQKREKITYLSYHDQLTGLYNRRYFEEELSRLDTERNIPFTIVMVDVNGLKLTNDTFGHQIGDKLLNRVTEVMKGVCRKDEIIARIGGDEFVILLPNTDRSAAKQLVSRIYSSMEKEKRLDNIIVSVSIGYETKVSKEQKIRDIFTKAEEYMYRKKLTESQIMRSDTIKVIIETLNETNNIERIHSDKVNKLARKIGEGMNLDHDVLKEIEIAGLMHDIGKIGIDKLTLYKPGKLTDSEYKEIKRHTETGYHILRSVDEYKNLADYALSHHERLDGKGYPRGLSGEQIPFIARIISVADAIEAITAERPYRKAVSSKEAIAEIVRFSGTQFDPSIAEICKELFLEGILDNILSNELWME